MATLSNTWNLFERPSGYINQHQRVHIVRDTLRLAYGHKLQQTDQLVAAVYLIDKYLSKHSPWYRKESDHKDVKSLEEMSYAAAIASDYNLEFAISRIILISSLMILLFLRNDVATQELRFYTTNQSFFDEFVDNDKDFRGIDLDSDEATILRRNANCMILVSSIMKPSQNLQFFMRLSSSLTEGKEYITGGGQSRVTSQRVKIYRKVTGNLLIPFNHLEYSFNSNHCIYFLFRS